MTAIKRMRGWSIECNGYTEEFEQCESDFFVYGATQPKDTRYRAQSEAGWHVADGSSNSNRDYCPLHFKKAT